MTLQDDPESHSGRKEVLTMINITEIIPSYKSDQLDVKPLTLDYGLHKLVYRIEVPFLYLHG